MHVEESTNKYALFYEKKKLILKCKSTQQPIETVEKNSKIQSSKEVNYKSIIYTNI